MRDPQYTPGMPEDIRALDEQYVMSTYKRLPGVYVRGEGCYMWDDKGNRYLDFLAGIIANPLAGEIRLTRNDFTNKCPQLFQEAKVTVNG